MNSYTEDTLVQQTTAEFMETALGWQSVYAFNTETFGPEGTLGRKDDRQVVLTRYLREKLVEFNPGLPDMAYDDAVRQVVSTTATQSPVATNREKYGLIRDGVQVAFRDSRGQRVRQRLRLFDFETPENNHFLCVRELWVRGDLYRRRADVIGFVNGLPLLFMELKNVHVGIRAAYDQNFQDYKDTVSHLFHHNAFIVLANGIDAKIGTLTSRYEHFHEWKRLAEDEPGAVEMETLLKGVCDKRNFMDLLENFILFDDSSGKTVKILARNHQYLGVNRAMEAVRDQSARMGRLGVFWHTQGAGKSYSMVLFSRKVHRKIGGNFTFLVVTDREDLDTQIYKTYAGCGVVDNDKNRCRAANGTDLKALLCQHKAYVFGMIHKFNQKVAPEEPYSLRDDVIVISDEAHRTHYGLLALNMRNALPHASYIGFTGTPLFKDDEITRKVFGDYVSTYDFKRAVDDNATVPLYYDTRGDRLKVSVSDLNERVAAKLEELEVEDVDVQQRLEQALRQDYHIITAPKRLEQIAEDFVTHYANAWESGKAMFVCIDKITCVRMFDLVGGRWRKRIEEFERSLGTIQDEQEMILRQRQIAWMQQTRMAVVVSEEQGEMAKFAKWGLDITPHRQLIKNGMDLPDEMKSKPEYWGMQTMSIDEAFKASDHPFRVVFVCAMWLTGFDVPSLGALYLDKPLKAHTLMQAIARANRVAEGKNNGLIVDYCGILKNLRKALSTFAGTNDDGHKGEDSEQEAARPEEEILEDLKEAISLVHAFLEAKGASLTDVMATAGFEKNLAIKSAKEAANENDSTRKHFEMLCREVFRKFKACINVKGINKYRDDYAAASVVYRSLQNDREKADITDIIRELHGVVEDVVEPRKSDHIADPYPVYDISKIDFDRLRREFERSTTKKTTVQNLKKVLADRLLNILLRNPLRTDFQAHYEKIVAEYNREKDRVTIEQTFDAMMNFMQEMDEEESRAVKEGLDEETLAIFDLLKRNDLNSAQIKKVKKVAVGLLEVLKAERLRVARWRERETTRDAVQVAIHDFLYSEETGLPVGAYSEEDVEARTADVFRHIYRAYPTLPSPYYGVVAA